MVEYIECENCHHGDVCAYRHDPGDKVLVCNHYYDKPETKRGKWISCKNNSGYKCSNCGARIKNSAFFTGNHIWCHKCGYKMTEN